jgi:uncharacterized protein YgiM (DUF1202 family)
MRSGKVFILVMILGFLGCAAGKVEVAPAPRPEIKSYYYVSAQEMDLKNAPSYESSNVGKVNLNERVEKVELGPSGWFQVRTAGGRQGWINEKYLKIDPVSEFFVQRWGVRLKAAPGGTSKAIANLRPNDQVKLLEKTPQGWAKVSVARLQETGWVEMRDLSVDRVVIRPVRRKPVRAAKEPAEEEATEEVKEPQPSAPSLLAPSPAKAEPPPAEEVPSQPKVKPERFEPF